ncbi:MAG: translation initiation factor IF-2 [Hyphomicrobiales bacterium]|nr:translation initiation factor IF-2 [Hyphomicrobiales bacterium]
MSDNKDDKKKPVLKMGRPSSLQLTKTVETGKVQQNISRGRSKTIMVEVRKTRTFSRDQEGRMVAESKKPLTEVVEAPSSGDGLTEEERNARLRALKESGEKSPQRPAAEETFQAKAVSKPKKAPPPPTEEPPAKAKEEKHKTKQQPAIAEKKRFEEERPQGKPKPERQEKKRYSKLTLANAMEQEERIRSLSSIRRAREKAKRAEHSAGSQEDKFIAREVVVPETITVQELANRMAVRGVDVVKELMKLGIMATVNQTIDADTAELLVSEFGHKIKRVTEADVENVLLGDGEEAEENLKPRPPVVTIMGHVDHGKTTLLDALRTTDVAAGEAGGITQHIGAYQVELQSGQHITFLDTPGHAAFTAMRARGAKVTDIVVLVVAADDSIMPQTEEAISHAKAAEVPIIVAINKIDKPDADPKKVKDALLAYELIPEDLGGDTMVAEVSALQKLNLDKLEEAILLQAEVLELKANPNRKAAGYVIEAKVDKGKGNVATLLVQKGTLRPGDIVVAGMAWGKIRQIADDKGNILEEAGPATPVEIQGLNSLPEAGDVFAITDTEKQAREITEFRQKKLRDVKAADNMKRLDTLFQQKADKKELTIIVKGDVQGSVEAICGSLEKLGTDEVSVKPVHSAAGAISESDIMLAKTTNALIVGFNVRATAKAKELASQENIDLRYYSVIYDLVDDVKALLTGMLAPKIREEFLGNAEILEAFKISKVGKVAGCKVTEGSVKRGAKVRLIRDGVVVHEGLLRTLKRFKDEVAEVKEGTECGMAFENYDNIQPGDIIEAFEIIEEKQTLAESANASVNA